MSSGIRWIYRLLFAGAAVSFVFNAFLAGRISSFSIFTFVCALVLAVAGSRLQWPGLRSVLVRRTLALLLAILALWMLISGDLSGRKPAPLALVGVTVITGKAPGAAIEDATLLIDEAGLIAEVGARGDVEVPAGVEVVELPGQYVMPGLINAHDHLMMVGDRHPDEPMDFSNYASDNLGGAIGEKLLRTYPVRRLILRLMERNAERAVRGGVTTVRELATVEFLDVVLRDRIEGGERLGPRILAAGQPICITGGHGHQIGTVIDGPNEARRAVRLAARNRVDAIKITSTGGVADSLRLGEAGELQMTPDEIRAVVDEAHRKGLLVAAHVESRQGVLEALRAGVDNIEHGAPLTPEALALFKNNPLSLRGYSTLHATLSVLAGGVARESLDSSTRSVAVMSANAEIIQERLVEGFKDALEGGVMIGVGTDAGVIRHDKVWKELEYFVRHGDVTSAEAIHMATLQTARSIGIEDTTGSIEPGKSADLIVLARDPRKDLSVLDAPGIVIARGAIMPAQ